MRTRPVFESYSAFVSSLYNTINEAETPPISFDKFITDLSSFLGEPGSEAFKSARRSASVAPLLSDTQDGSLGSALADLKIKIQKIIKSTENDTLKLSIPSIVEVGSLKYDIVVNGKILLNEKLSGILNQMSAVGDIFEEFATGQWVDMNDIVTIVNFNNIHKYESSTTKPAVEEGKKKTIVWDLDEGTDDVSYTGPGAQRILVNIDAGVSFSSITGQKTPVIASSKLKPNKSTDTKVYSTLVIYGLGEYIPADATTKKMIPSQVIKKQFVKVEGTPQEYEQVIDGGTGMFAQNESGVDDINKLNKDKISNILGAILAPLAGIPESITITGGASFEGGLDNNKKLVVQRAKAVKSLFESLYPELVKGDIITAVDNDFSKIQPKDEPAKYPEWRKVYIKVKGVLKSDTKVEEKTFVVDEDNPAGSVVINQYLISFEYTDSSLTA